MIKTKIKSIPISDKALFPKEFQKFTKLNCCVVALFVLVDYFFNV